MVRVEKSQRVKLKLMENISEHAAYLFQAATDCPDELQQNLEIETECCENGNIHKKLCDLYISGIKSGHPEFCPSNLLRDLVAKENLNTLIVSLLPENEGFTIGGCNFQTDKLPYEEGELLDYIDKCELPPLLLDLFDRCEPNIFYNGCVIVEVRDYRLLSDHSKCTSAYALLEPTTYSLLCDIDMLTANDQWTQDEKDELESILVLKTAKPLCLDPSPVVAAVRNLIEYNKRKLNMHCFKKLAEAHSQVIKNRKRKLVSLPPLPPFVAMDFQASKRRRQSTPIEFDTPSCSLECPTDDDFRLKASDLYMIEKNMTHLKNYMEEETKQRKDDELVPVKEYIMEIERSKGVTQCSKIKISKNCDEIYYGTLCLSREGEEGSTSTSFKLGSKEYVEKYVHQFREIFTEEGRIAVNKDQEENDMDFDENLCKSSSVEISLPSHSDSATSYPPISTPNIGTLKTPTNFTVESIMSSSSSHMTSENHFYDNLNKPDINDDEQANSVGQHFAFRQASGHSPPNEDLSSSFPMAVIGAQGISIPLAVAHSSQPSLLPPSFELPIVSQDGYSVEQGVGPGIAFIDRA